MYSDEIPAAAFKSSPRKNTFPSRRLDYVSISDGCIFIAKELLYFTHSLAGLRFARYTAYRAEIGSLQNSSLFGWVLTAMRRRRSPQSARVVEVGDQLHQVSPDRVAEDPHVGIRP